MEQLKSVDSPCTHVCEIDENTGLCKSCFRTMDEISGWSNFNSNDKREVYRLIDKRKKVLEDFKGETLPLLKWLS